MKNRGSTLFKIAGILSIVMGAINCLPVVTCVVGIPLIIGGVECLKYADLTDEQVIEKETPIIVWTVVFLLLNTISGILSLIALFQAKTDKQQTNTQPKDATEVTGTVRPEEKTHSDDVLKKLERLNKMKEDGLISEEEYTALKEDIFNK